MAVVTPNIEASPSFDGMSVPDATDLYALCSDAQGTGVVSGMLVTQDTGSDMKIAVASGVVSVAGVEYTFAGTGGSPVTVGAAGTADRRDTVVYRAGTGIVVIAGTGCLLTTANWTRAAGDAGVIPPVKAGVVQSTDVVLAELYIAGTGGTGTTAVVGTSSTQGTTGGAVTGNIVDKRNVLVASPLSVPSGTFQKVTTTSLSTATVGSGSNGVNVNTFTGSGVLNTGAAISGYASSGVVVVPTTGGYTAIQYTGWTGTTFTGCTTLYGGAGTMSTGGIIYQAAVVTVGAAGTYDLAAISGGGGGGGGGTGVVSNVGGGGGGAGVETHGIYTLTAGQTLAVVVGAGGAGGASAAAAGNAGGGGSNGGFTLIIGTGVGVSAAPSTGGSGGGANSTANANGGVPGSLSGSGTTTSIRFPGAGGVSGANGSAAVGYIGGGGAGGGAASATGGGNGGTGGAAGVLSGLNANAGTTAGSGSTAGGTGSSAAANSAAGGGGGGGAGTAGASGAGGSGGSGWAWVKQIA